MKLELVQWNKKKNKMYLRVHGANAAFTNLIRRTAMDEVPTLAIEDVEFRDNSSALYDEMVAHRLGLIPIKTDLNSYVLKTECSCSGEGCAKCELKITLKGTKKGVITASEAKSQDPKCTFVYPDMPIAKITAKQKVECEATAILGKGKDHVKWSPGLVFYRNEQTVNASSVKLDNEQKERVKKACGTFVSTEGKIKVDTDKLLTTTSDACFEVLEDMGAEITDTDRFIMTVESWGQLGCKDILEQAATIIIQKLDGLKEHL
jgi:DNA-directed RNA polymerase subunit D